MLETRASQIPNYSCLIVDDDKAIRELANRHFTRQGFECKSVGDGIEASSLLAQKTFDCVLIDLQIPGKNGHALCVEALNLPNPPLVSVVTGLAIPRIESDLRRRGMTHLYRKPGNLGEIARNLRADLDSRTSSQETAPDQEPPTTSEVAYSPSTDDISRQRSDHERDSLRAERREVSSEHFMVVVFCRAKERTTRLSELIHSAGFSTIAAESSDDLLEILNSTRIDLLLIERELRGFVNGLQIIESIYEQLLSVNVVLLSSEDKQQLPDTPAMENVLRHFATSMTDEALVEAIIQVLRSMKSNSWMIDAHARRLVVDAERIPPMPHVLSKIVSYLEQPVEDIDLDRLARDIEVDARLTTELLRVTNSSSTGVANKVTVTRDAVRLLGGRRAITLCLTLGIRTMNAELLKPWGNDLRDWYLRRVTLTACVSSIMAQRFEKVPHESAFLLGILQDIGILVFAEHYGEKYFARVIQRVRTVAPLVLVASEKLVTNTDHAQVSAAVLKLWGFPPTIIEPVLIHHQPVAPGQSKLVSSFVKCMKIAELFADFADHPAAQRRKALNDFVKEHFPNREGQCASALIDAVSQAQEMSQQFNTPKIETELLREAIAKLKQHRDSEDAPLDLQE